MNLGPLCDSDVGVYPLQIYCSPSTSSKIENPSIWSTFNLISFRKNSTLKGRVFFFKGDFLGPTLYTCVLLGLLSLQFVYLGFLCPGLMITNTILREPLSNLFSMGPLSRQIIRVVGLESSFFHASETFMANLTIKKCFFYQECDFSWVGCLTFLHLGVLSQRCRGVTNPKNTHTVSRQHALFYHQVVLRYFLYKLLFLSISPWSFPQAASETMVHPTGANLVRVRLNTVIYHRAYHRRTPFARYHSPWKGGLSWKGKKKRLDTDKLEGSCGTHKRRNYFIAILWFISNEFITNK